MRPAWGSPSLEEDSIGSLRSRGSPPSQEGGGWRAVPGSPLALREAEKVYETIGTLRQVVSIGRIQRLCLVIFLYGMVIALVMTL